MPKMTPYRSCLGCFSIATIVGAFAAGVYLGVSNSKGIMFGSGTESMLKYSPVFFSGVLSFANTINLVKDPQALDELVDSPFIPWHQRENMRGCAGGCAPIISPLFAMAVTGISTAAGYYLGSKLN